MLLKVPLSSSVRLITIEELHGDRGAHTVPVLVAVYT
jgi:hypothetical protein